MKPFSMGRRQIDNFGLWNSGSVALIFLFILYYFSSKSNYSFI